MWIRTSAIVVVIGIMSAGCAGQQDAKTQAAGATQPTTSPTTFPTTSTAPDTAVAAYRDAADMLSRNINNETDLTDDCDTVPLDDATGKFLADRQPIIALLNEAATMPTGDWGDPGGQIEPVLTDLASVRHDARLLFLAARYSAAQNQIAEAEKDLLAAMALARHVGRERLILARLVEIGIESSAIDRLATMLAAMSKDALAALPKKLAALPATTSGEETMNAECVFNQSAMKLRHGPVLAIAALAPFYDEIGKAMTLPVAQFDARVKAEAAKRKLNPYARSIVPVVLSFRRQMLIVEAKRAMLACAIEIEQSGADAVKRSRDPASTQPFAYRATAGGFVLTSQAQERGEKARLVVGR